VLLFTGKGGVGKSTIAAATAVRAAELGLRVHVVSTDAAHSLGDVFGIEIGDAGVEVCDGLTASEPDARIRLEAGWDTIRLTVAAIAGQSGISAIQAGELTVIPGADELIALSVIGELADRTDLDLVVVDCAPTAETIRLLSAPQVINWWIDRLAPVAAPWIGMVGPILEQTVGVELPKIRALDDLRRLSDRLSATQRLLTDTARTGVRLVSAPNPVVVAETRRAHSYLSLFGLRVDAAIMNRILPAAVADPFFERWRKVEAEQVERLTTDLDPVPVWPVELAGAEIVGVEALAALGRAIYGAEDPTARSTTCPSLVWASDGDRATLTMAIGAVDGSSIDVGRHRGELIITIGPHRRMVALPDSLLSHDVATASLEQGSLNIGFELVRRV